MTEVVRVGSRIRVSHLKARSELNGSLGTVMGLNKETGRFNVKVDDIENETLALKPEALILAVEFDGLAVGDRVRIAALQDKPDLSGKLATVEGFQGDRCNIKVDGGGPALVALRPAMLSVAEGGASCSTGVRGDGSRQVRVECNDVLLKLTLTAKLLKKPLAEAVLKPFLKAYSKKVGLDPPATVDQVKEVVIDSDGQTGLKKVTDIHIFPTEDHLKGLRGDIDIDVFLSSGSAPPPFRVPEDPEMQSSDELPVGSRVEIHGLTSTAGLPLNGMRGTVAAYQAERERYDIKIYDCEGLLRGDQERNVCAKFANLRLLDVGVD